MAAGVARPHESAELIKGLLAEGDRRLADEEHHRPYLFALASLETTVELDPNVRKSVLEKAALLIPPKDDDQVLLFIKGGSEVVPLLQPNHSHNQKEAIRCIEVLAGIGGDAALSVLSQYAQEYNDEEYNKIQRALCEAWFFFERQVYADKIFIHLTRLDLSSTQVSDISALSGLSSLQRLYLSSTQVSDVSALSNLSSLQELYLSSTQVRDVWALSSLSSLIRLYLNSTLVSDVSVLSDLSSLRYLYLDFTGVSDVSALKEKNKELLVFGV